MALTFARQQQKFSELVEVLAATVPAVPAGIIKGHLWRLQITIDAEGRLQLPEGVTVAHRYGINTPQQIAQVPQGAA
jgi:hypothetical protein